MYQTAVKTVVVQTCSYQYMLSFCDDGLYVILHELSRNICAASIEVDVLAIQHGVDVSVYRYFDSRPYDDKYQYRQCLD